MPLSHTQGDPIWVNALVFLAAAAVVWGAGTRLTRYTDAVSAQTGMGRVFAGMVFLGLVTSLPEIANAISASAVGNPALAINNLLGSAAINVLLLAVVDAFIGRDAVTSIVAKPSTMMMAALSILVLVAIAMAITTGDLPVLGVGMWSLLLCAASIGGFWLAAAYDRGPPPWTPEEPRSGPGERPDEERARAPLQSLVPKMVIAGAVLFAAGYALSRTGDALAEQTGIGTGMVGFLLIGIATSMPELSTIVTSFRIRRYQMAFGQVLGTNFINFSLFLLADAVFAGGPVVNELGAFETVSALLGAMLTGVFLVGLLERRNPTIMRMGYDSLVVMLLFAVGTVILYIVR